MAINFGRDSVTKFQGSLNSVIQAALSLDFNKMGYIYNGSWGLINHAFILRTVSCINDFTDTAIEKERKE